MDFSQYALILYFENFNPDAASLQELCAQAGKLNTAMTDALNKAFTANDDTAEGFLKIFYYNRTSHGPEAAFVRACRDVTGPQLVSGQSRPALPKSPAGGKPFASRPG